jgi:type II secretory pathway pseudopilin PulG
MRRLFPRRPLSAGFTVIELIVSTMILSMVGAVVFILLSRLNQSAQPALSDRLVVNNESTRAANILINHIRECLEVVRPMPGETTPYLVLKNDVNEMNLLYLEPDPIHAQIASRTLYKLVSFTQTGSPDGLSKELFASIQRLTFTSLSPNQVQINLVLANLKGEFGLVTQVGLQSFGGLE